MERSSSTPDIIMNPRFVTVLFLAAFINVALLFLVSATFIGGIPDPFIHKSSPPYMVSMRGVRSYLGESTWRACQWWARISIALAVFAAIARLSSNKAGARKGAVPNDA